MAIVKLVCQGCGANLDALDNQRILQCGYCGTANQIKQTVHQAAPADASEVPPSGWLPPGASAPPRSQLPNYGPSYQAAPHLQAQAAGASGRAGKALGMIIVLGTLAPLVVGGVIAWMAVRTASDAVDRAQGFGAGVDGAGGKAPQWRFESGRPFAADVDGDGHEDLLGRIQVMGSQDVRLGVASGAKDWAPLWELSLGDRANLPGGAKLFYQPEINLALVAVGASLTAYDAATGEQRWVASMTDMVEGLALEPSDGPSKWELRVASKDKQIVGVDVATGKPTGTSGPPSADAVRIASDEGYELIPDLRYLDLQWDQFEGLRTQAAFCPERALPFVIGHRFDDEDKRCGFAHGLAWAGRAEGTSVPFWVGYDPSTKAERWRVQMTKPGTLETVDSGFAQPRAELFEDEALVGFQPSQGDELLVRRISLVDGEIRWEAGISTKQGGQLSALVLGDSGVYVVYNGRAYVFDPATGAARGAVGTWDW